jgi:hypothetical protein
MTIITTQSRVTYAGDNVSTVFPIPFEFFLNSDINAVKTAAAGGVTTLVLGVDYSLSGAGTPGGGSAAKSTPLLTDETLAFFLNPPVTQGSHYQSNSPFPASTVENDLDRQTQISQRIADIQSRSLRAPDADPVIGTVGFLLPSAVARKNTFLTFDANGNPAVATLLPGGTLSLAAIVALTGAQTPAEAAAGVTPVNLQYLPYTPRRYGAIGDGITNDSAAWQLALQACPAGGLIQGNIGDNYKANTLHITKSVIIDLNGCTMTSTAYASGMSHKIFYCQTADAVGAVTIKSGKLVGAGTNRGGAAAEQESLIWLDTVGTVVLRDLDISGHAAGIQTIPPALKDRILSAILVRFPTLNCTLDNVTVHDNWNEQISVYNTAGSNCFIEAVNCKSYDGQTNPANTPLEVTGGFVSIHGCHFFSTNASIININVPNSADIYGNTLIGNASAGSQGYGINCGQDGLTGYANNVTIANNIIQNTMQGGIAVMGSNVKVVGNTISNSGSVALASGGYGIKARAAFNPASFASLLPDYPVITHQDLVDLLIEGNTINDTVFSGPLTGTGIHVEMTDNAWTGATYNGQFWRGVVIRNNSIRQINVLGATQLNNGIVLGYAVDSIIEGNKLHDAINCPILIDGQIENLKIARNKFSATSAQSQTGSTILFFNNNTLQTFAFDNVTIEENVFSSYPAPGNFDVQVDTTNAGSSPVVTSNFRFINNQGILMGIGGASINLTQYSYRKDDYPFSTVIPGTTGTTYNQFDIVPSKPVATGVQGWVNVNPAGTLGTLNGGATTGAITINTNTLTVSSAAGLAIGQVISVAGAVATAIIANIAGTTITLTSKATATVAAAAVAYVNPLFKTIGAVGA